MRCGPRFWVITFLGGHFGLCESFGGFIESIGEDAHHAFHFAARFAQCFYGVEAALAGAHEVFHHHHTAPHGEIALHLVLHAVVLGAAAHINEGKTQIVRYQCTVGYAARGHTSDHVRPPELVVDHMHELLADVRANSRVGERLAVVAIDRALPSAGPRKWLLRT